MEDYDATSMEQLKSKDKLKEIIWTLILYIIYMIYWVVFQLILSLFKLDYKNYYKGNPCSIIGSL